VPGVALMQNQPNPFNPSTEIAYTPAEPGHARVQVYSLDGKLVRTLVDAHHDQARTYGVTWNGRDASGRSLPSGLYFYRLVTPQGALMKTMTLLK
jgi:flagellar hook assembly protein FlgD